MERLLVAVADSPASLMAARTAVAPAARLRAELRVVHVVQDGDMREALGPGVSQRREAAADSMLVTSPSSPSWTSGPVYR